MFLILNDNIAPDCARLFIPTTFVLNKSNKKRGKSTIFQLCNRERAWILFFFFWKKVFSVYVALWACFLTNLSYFQS